MLETCIEVLPYIPYICHGLRHFDCPSQHSHRAQHSQTKLNTYNDAPMTSTNGRVATDLLGATPLCCTMDLHMLMVGCMLDMH